MSIEQSVVESLRVLPPEKQQEVLDFAEFLRHRSASPHPRRNLEGMWSDVDITAEDIAEARRDMWSNFPREDT